MTKVERLVGWLLRLLRRERFEIGRGDDVYLVRWTLLGERYGPDGKLFLHYFHRSDGDGALHNHPWGFWSLILGPGYYEETGGGVKTWYGPLRLLRRPPSWRHRVELDRGRRCWTLVWTGPRVQSWGFFCPGGFVGWREYTAREGAGASGCGD